jgi:hypothetical protein
MNDFYRIHAMHSSLKNVLECNDCKFMWYLESQSTGNVLDIQTLQDILANLYDR